MATARDLRRIALSLEGTSEAPHFDRTAFKVRRIYATLAADGRTANLMFTPDEQALKCTVAPEAFSPVPNAWGLWNVLFVALRSRLQLSIGLHGALLPILLAPLGIVVASLLNFPIPSFAGHAFPIAAPVALLVYYFAWKYLVGFLNRVQEIA